MLRIHTEITSAKGTTSDHVEYTPSTKDNPSLRLEGLPLGLRNLTLEER